MSGDENSLPKSPKLSKAFIHPAFTVSNIRNHVRLVLDSDKVLYSSWAALFKLHVRAFKVIDFIDGSPRTGDLDDATWSQHADIYPTSGDYKPYESCIATSLSAPFGSRRTYLLRLSQGYYDNKTFIELRCVKAETSYTFARGVPSLKRKNVLFAISEDRSLSTENGKNVSEFYSEDISDAFTQSPDYEGEESGGKPGLVSFYNRPYKKDEKTLLSPRNESSVLWFIGPAVLIASFILPSLYLRKLISSIFEDSLLTDFLILFFTEALFYCGVAVYLLVINHLRKPAVAFSAAMSSINLPLQLGDRLSSVTVLVLSLTIPMVTMGYVWPWTGPAASATLAPYLVGIVVQFAFEQYASYKRSPSLPTIPIVFHIYRLHQLNRAAQLVTALSFTVRGAEMNSHNIAINSSLRTLLNVLQFLGVICIWSLSSFIMRFFPSIAILEQQQSMNSEEKP